MIIGICGLGFSGSGAVLDLLHEYDDVDGFSECEMSICYYPDGIEDLDYHLNTCYSRYMSSDAAIYSFEKMIRARFGHNKGLRQPVYAKKIMDLTRQYISDISQIEWKGSWGYRDYNDGPLKIFINCNILQRISLLIHKVFNKNIQLAPLKTMRLSILPEDFDIRTKRYIIDVLKSIGYSDNKKRFVVDQLFSGDNPEKSFKYFDNPYAIIVKRDPRDTYLLAKNMVKVYAGWIPTDDVSQFIEYYRRIYGNIRYSNLKRVLIIQYEDLIYKYNDTVKMIEAFCGIHLHTREKKYFNPEYSRRYTQLIKNYPKDKEAIQQIERELQQYIYQFPKEKERIKKTGRIIV